MASPALTSPVHGANPWQGADQIRAIIAANLKGDARGVYSVCCSHSMVIEAAIDQAIADGGTLLVEATANQVNQFGGYTGMRPTDYRDFVLGIAAERGLPAERVILGGDHLGPVCWTGDGADEAMDKAEVLVREYAAAGFAKIHLDCSMALSGDPEVLHDQTVAARAARLCAAAEDSAVATFGSSGIAYVIGTEVPPPGGADEALDCIEVTDRNSVDQTLAVHHDAFDHANLGSAWQRVIAVVVQPGVEFDHSAVIDYRPTKAQHLKSLAEAPGNAIAFEAHSTDYQRPQAFAALVRDHFAVLKVGPALTFALREALFALSHIEDELVSADRRSNLRQICEERMLAEPKNWQRFYHGTEEEQRILRRFSLSDRIRYYWPDPAIEAATQRLLANIAVVGPVPLGLLSQHLPLQLDAIREGALANEPVELVKSAVRFALAPYAAACNGEAA